MFACQRCVSLTSQAFRSHIIWFLLSWVLFAVVYSVSLALLSCSLTSQAGQLVIRAFRSNSKHFSWYGMLFSSCLRAFARVGCLSPQNRGVFLLFEALGLGTKHYYIKKPEHNPGLISVYTTGHKDLLLITIFLSVQCFLLMLQF